MHHSLCFLWYAISYRTVSGNTTGEIVDDVSLLQLYPRPSSPYNASPTGELSSTSESANLRPVLADNRGIGGMDGNTNKGSEQIVVLFIAGLEDTGHHVFHSIFALSEYVAASWFSGRSCRLGPGWWKDAMVTGTTLPIGIPNVKAPEMSSKTLHMYQSKTNSEIQKIKTRPATIVLNTLETMMLAYPAHNCLQTSPNMTVAKQIFDNLEFDFRVLQLSRDIKSYLPGGVTYDRGNITLHAAVLAEHGDYMAQQLSKIPVSKRACVRYETFLEQADALQAFIGVSDFASIARGVFKSRRVEQPVNSSVINNVKGVQSLLDVHDRLEHLCSEAILQQRPLVVS